METGILASVTAPLAFFTLCLLIVEAFLASAIIGGNLERTLKIQCVWAGIALFVFVIITVSLFVWFKPQNLLFDKDTLYKQWDYEKQLEFRKNTNKQSYAPDVRTLHRRRAALEATQSRSV